MKNSNRPIIILTGCSGSGKSTAMAAFEDAGFYCIDNMPVQLVKEFLVRHNAEDKSAVGWTFGMDLRDRHFLSDHAPLVDDLKSSGYPCKTVFLDAEEQVLLRRYNQTRRHHPLGAGGSLLDAIRAEKQHLHAIRAAADHLIDTTQFSVHELKFAILAIALKHADITTMAINVVSFGFKYGTPREADLLMDVRFLTNPYFNPTLKDQDGESGPVADFVLQNEDTGLFLHKFYDMLDFLIPRYEKEGKAYLTIAIGCTGGRHRSVVIARSVFEHLKRSRPAVRLIHRDIQYS